MGLCLPGLAFRALNWGGGPRPLSLLCVKGMVTAVVLRIPDCPTEHSSGMPMVVDGKMQFDI
jgi:hypothetical protein